MMRVDERVAEMENDDNNRYQICRFPGVAIEEGRLIDIYQNKGSFLYKYAGSFPEEAAKLCFLKTFPDSRFLTSSNQKYHETTP